MQSVDIAELSRRLTAALTALAPGTSLVAAYGFGSVFGGEAAADSDLDIALLFDEASLDEVQRFDSAASIHRRLEKVSPIEIDLVVLNEAPPALVDRAVRTGRVLFGDSDPRRVRFEQRSLLDYLDFLPVLERYDRALLARAREGRFGA